MQQPVSITKILLKLEEENVTLPLLTNGRYNMKEVYDFIDTVLGKLTTEQIAEVLRVPHHRIIYLITKRKEKNV